MKNNICFKININYFCEFFYPHKKAQKSFGFRAFFMFNILEYYGLTASTTIA